MSYFFFLLPSFLNFMSSSLSHLYRESYSRAGQAFVDFSFSNLALSVTSDLNLVENRLCLHSCTRILIAFNNDTFTSSRVFLTWLDVMKSFVVFFHQENNTVITHINCLLWSSTFFVSAELVSGFLPCRNLPHC